MNKKYYFFILFLFFIFTYSESIIFSPKEIRKKIKSEVSKAKESILILTEVFSDKDLADSIISKKEKGTQVTVIVNSSSLNKIYSVHKILYNNGIEILSYSSEYTIKNTIIISDNKILFMGTFPISPEKYFHDDFCLITQNRESIDSAFFHFNSVKAKSKKYSVIIDTIFFDEISDKMVDYSNKEVFIRGYVSDVSKSSKSNTYFLKLKKGKNVMTIVFFNDFVKALEKKSVSPMYFMHKEILINGILINHEKYGFEIIPSDVSQIKIYVD